MICLENDILIAKTKEEIYKKIAKKLYEKKYIYSEKNFLKKIYEREEVGNLYIGNGILLPHIKNKTVKKNMICIYRLKNPILEIKIIICILVKERLGLNDYKKIVRFIKDIDDNNIRRNILEGKIWKLEK